MFFSVVMLKCWVLLFGNILFFEFPETEDKLFDLR